MVQSSMNGVLLYDSFGLEPYTFVPLDHPLWNTHYDQWISNHKTVDDTIEIEFNEFVGYGCSTTLNGEFYYVGGGNTNKQVNILMIEKTFILT